MLFSPSEQTCCTPVMWLWMGDCSFTLCILIIKNKRRPKKRHIHQSGVLTMLFGCYVAGTMWKCCCLGACSVCTIQPRISLPCQVIQSHICRVRVFSCKPTPAFLAETQDLLRVTVVTWGWNRYWNKSTENWHRRRKSSLHLHFWQNAQEFFRCYCGNMGVEQILK